VLQKKIRIKRRKMVVKELTVKRNLVPKKILMVKMVLNQATKKDPNLIRF